MRAPRPAHARRIAATLPLALLAVGAACAPRSNGSPTPQVASGWWPAGPELARGDTVERLGPGVVSDGAEFASAFTPDGRTVFFTRANEDRTRLALMRSRHTGTGWSAPEPLPMADVGRAMDPHVAPDGRWLYFTAPRVAGAGREAPGGDWDTWVAELRSDGTTGAYRNLGAPNTERLEMYASVTRAGALYYGVALAAGSSDSSVRGLWRADLPARGAAVRLPEPVNAFGGDAGNPYVTPDERILLFNSGRPGGQGRADLWMSVRDVAGDWGTPVNLGSVVNGPEAEFCPQLSPDGRFLLFSRIHFVGDERRGSDIYVVRVTAVPALAAALATGLAPAGP